MPPIHILIGAAEPNSDGTVACAKFSVESIAAGQSAVSTPGSADADRGRRDFGILRDRQRINTDDAREACDDCQNNGENRSGNFAMQEAARHMRAGGRIINISSNGAVSAPVPGSAIYGMWKSALTAMAHALSREFAPEGITVNAIQPGPTKTDEAFDMEDLLIAQVPAGRLADVSKLASLVEYLAGPDAGFINGAAVTTMAR